MNRKIEKSQNCKIVKSAALLSESAADFHKKSRAANSRTEPGKPDVCHLVVKFADFSVYTSVPKLYEIGVSRRSMTLR